MKHALLNITWLMLLPLGAAGQHHLSVSGWGGFDYHRIQNLGIDTEPLYTLAAGVHYQYRIAASRWRVQAGLQATLARLNATERLVGYDAEGNPEGRDSLFLKSMGWVGLPVTLRLQATEALALAVGVQPDYRIYNVGNYTADGYRRINWQPCFELAYEVFSGWQVSVLYQHGMSNIVNRQIEAVAPNLSYHTSRLLFGIGYRIF